MALLTDDASPPAQNWLSVPFQVPPINSLGLPRGQRKIFWRPQPNPLGLPGGAKRDDRTLLSVNYSVIQWPSIHVTSLHLRTLLPWWWVHSTNTAIHCRITQLLVQGRIICLLKNQVSDRRISACTVSGCYKRRQRPHCKPCRYQYKDHGVCGLPYARIAWTLPGPQGLSDLNMPRFGGPT